MHRRILPLVLSLATLLAADDTSRASEVRFRAEVQDIATLATFSGRVMPVGFNPKFAVTMKIASATPAQIPFVPGAVVTFAVHSPSMIFGSNPAVKGNTFAFVIRHSFTGDQPTYTGLALQPTALR